jgi:CheY-like chemotaxis protein
MTSPTTYRILLVEDDGSIAQIIQIFLKDLRTPYHLDVAFSAEEGVDLWQREPYDLLLTDYNLRGKNGLDLVTQLKGRGSTAPMVLFTAYDSPQLRRAARNAGVTKFIAKPFFLDQFVDLTRSLLPTTRDRSA